MTADTQTVDPFEAADNAEAPPSTVFGQVTLDVWFCALVKGQGKVPFDPAQHEASQKATAVDITISPVVAGRYEAKRSMIAESREWASIVKPSIIGLGLKSVKDINGKWVEAQFAPTGRTYESGGETRQATTTKFIRLFASEDECLTAAGGPRDTSAPAATPAKGGPSPAMVEQFLRAVVSRDGADLAKLQASLSANPILAHLRIDSPEVVALLTGGA